MKLLLFGALVVTLVASVGRAFAIGRRRGVPLRTILTASGEQMSVIVRVIVGLFLLLLLTLIAVDIAQGDFSRAHDGKLMVFAIFFGVVLWAVWPRGRARR